MSEKKDNKELMRAVKFTLFSISAGIIQILVTEVLLNFVTNWDYSVRYLIGLVASVIWNFTFNRKYTFQSANNVPVAMLKVAAFYVVFTPLSTILAAFLEGTSNTFAWTAAFTSGSPHLPEIVVQLIIMALNFVTEFIYDKFVVFRGSIDTNEIAKKKEEV